MLLEGRSRNLNSQLWKPEWINIRIYLTICVVNQQYFTCKEKHFISNIIYRKNSKYWDTQTSYRSCPWYKTVIFYKEVMPPKDAERMANSVDPDQTAP